MANRIPLTQAQLEKLELYSELHENIVDVLLEHGSEMSEPAIFALEDALIAAVKPRESRSDFIEFGMLAAGAPHLIRAVERTWPNSKVFIDQFQNPESLGVSLSMVIHEDFADSSESLADSILDEHGRVRDPLIEK